MKERVAKQILDPVRLQILGHLADGSATASVLLKKTGASRPTLYRALDHLHAVGLIAVAAERRVRGTVERTWRIAIERDALTSLRTDPATLLASLTSVFAAFVAAPASALQEQDEAKGSASDASTIEQIERWVRASSAQLFVTHEEFHALREHLVELIAPYLSPRPETQRIRLSLFTVPSKEQQ